MRDGAETRWLLGQESRYPLHHGRLSSLCPVDKKAERKDAIKRCEAWSLQEQMCFNQFIQ